MSPRIFAFAGPRVLPPGGGDLILSALAQHTAPGTRWVVGCATGADAFVLSALLPREIASVFAAFGPDGYGACPVSSVSGVLAASAAGIPVTWWAGGVPPTPLAARLHGRTAAIVRAATAGLVAYLVPGSKGTALAVRLARSRGLPVFFIQ
ncbi:hypothetical protein CCP4SC76_3440002 [Gammaproteobacteria bacterium]